MYKPSVVQGRMQIESKPKLLHITLPDREVCIWYETAAVDAALVSYLLASLRITPGV